MTTFYFHSLSDTGESMSKAVCPFKEKLWTEFRDPDRGLAIPPAYNSVTGYVQFCTPHPKHLPIIDYNGMRLF